MHCFDVTDIFKVVIIMVAEINLAHCSIPHSHALTDSIANLVYEGGNRDVATCNGLLPEL